MSFSKPEVKLRNPAAGDIEWIGKFSEPGGLKVYSGEAKISRVFAEYDKIQMVVLDDSRRTITGFSDKLLTAQGKGSNIWSNEINQYKMKTRPFRVAAFDKDRTVIANGVWEDIKEVVEGKGGNYTIPLYVAIDFGGGFKIYIFKIRGASFFDWDRFIKSHQKDFTSHYIRIVGMEDKKKGSNEFHVPLYGLGDKLPNEVVEEMIALDTQLQEYLAAYDKRGFEHEVEEEGPPHVGRDEHEGEAAAEKVFDTANWKAFPIPHANGKTLGDLNESELQDGKETKESALDCADALYANICEGVRYYQKMNRDQAIAAEAAAKQPPTIETTVEKVTGANPFAKKEAPKANPFAKAEPKPVLDWKNVVIGETGKKIGDLDKGMLEECLAFCRTDDGIEYRKYEEALCLALGVPYDDNIPF